MDFHRADERINVDDFAQFGRENFCLSTAEAHAIPAVSTNLQFVCRLYTRRKPGPWDGEGNECLRYALVRDTGVNDAMDPSTLFLIMPYVPIPSH